MKAALHQSVTFWSGFLVMGFICWAWADSLGKVSSVGWRAFTGSNICGAITVGHWPSTYSNDYFWRRSSDSPYLSMEKPAWISPNFLRGGGETSTDLGEPTGEGTAHEFLLKSMRYHSAEEWLLVIPHWLLLLAVALPWLALLVWRARRRARLLPPAP